jgi:colicin import membrane protein
MPEIKPATAGTPYRVPPEPSRWPAILLAVAVHALLLGFLWFGISWQNHEPVAVEAEVWDMKTEAAAPTPPPPPEAEPEPPQPKPEPAPPPKAVEQPPERLAPQPDIALEREKKRKEELLKKREQERELAEQKTREEAKAKELAKKETDRNKADELAKKEAAEKKKAEELAKKEAEQKKADELAKKEADKKAKAEKLAKAKAEAAEKAKLDKLRQDELNRMMAAAAGSGGTGTAAKSTAPRSDSGYVAAITSKVKSNTTYGGSTDVSDNPRVEFQVEQLPTGEIISVRKTKSSGIPAFDDAVEKGIIKSSPLPKKKDGTVERSLQIGFKMKDVT